MSREAHNSIPESSGPPARTGQPGAGQSLPLDRLPYPTALLDDAGKILHASHDFPKPGKPCESLAGCDFLDWFEGDSRRLVAAFQAEYGGSLHRAEGSTARPPETPRQIGFCDVAAPFSPGLAFRLVPLIAHDHDPRRTLILVLPSRILNLSAPSVAQREMRLRGRLAAVLEVSQEIGTSLERDVILQRIVERVRRVVSVPEVVLFLLDEKEEVLVPVVAKVDEFYDEVMAIRLRLGEGIAGTVARTGRPEIVNHAEQDPRSIQVPGTPEEATSLLCVPLLVRGNLVGVLVLTRFGDQGFGDEDLELVTIFGAYCAAAIENSKLFENLRSTVEQLESTQDQLIQSAKLNALGEMAGGVAHDFNNVLTAIMGRTQLLLRWAEDPELRESLEIIEQTALIGARTVRRIQEFTRIRKDQGLEEADVNEVIRDVIELIRPRWKYPSDVGGVDVRAEVDLQSSQLIRGRAADLREVFTNVILNALDAMPEGGELKLVTRDEGDRVVIQISDTGVGMTDEIKERIFDPFFSTKSEQGTGLGLSVAYGIVMRHDGEIEVESRPGAGTTMHLKFPAVPETVSRRFVKADSLEAEPMHVLCVDDEKTVLEVLVELLEVLGQKAVEALGGEAGIEAARKEPPDIVFTDLGMPDVNGWQVATEIKSSCPEAVIVLVTGWGVQIDAENARQRGVDYILPKPYTLDEIKHLLAEIAEKKKAA